MKTRKAIMLLVCVVFILFCSNMVAFAVDGQNLSETSGDVLDNAVFDSDFNHVGSIKNFSFDGRVLSFDYESVFYSFEMKLYRADGKLINSKEVCDNYYGQDNQLSCSLFGYKDSYCFIVSDDTPRQIRKITPNSIYFTVIIGKNISAVADSMKSEIATIFENQDETEKTMNRGSLHVLANGASIPFLISSGVSEGWATATYVYNGTYAVTGLKYSVAANMPDDRVTLWYNYYTNPSIAYGTPIPCPVGYRTVSGTWMVSGTDGVLEAVTTVTAVVKGFPLGWKVYDICRVQ